MGRAIRRRGITGAVNSRKKHGYFGKAKIFRTDEDIAKKSKKKLMVSVKPKDSFLDNVGNFVYKGINRLFGKKG